MFNIVLFEPEIPPNTGNIIRLSSNTGCKLHLIEPLGFSLDEKSLRRAGLDYHQYSSILTYKNWSNFISNAHPNRMFAISTKGNTNYCNIEFQAEDYFIFGPETRGLPESILQSSDMENVLRIPMQENSRSLNLSNTVAILVYEAWRQCDFA